MFEKRLDDLGTLMGILFNNIGSLARSTELRPVTTLLGAFSHTRLRLVRPYRALARLRLARLGVRKKIKNAAPLCRYSIFSNSPLFKAKKIFMEGFTFTSLFAFIEFYYIDLSPSLIFHV